MPKPTIDAVVICDDIRREVTGKDLLIGVYTGDIVLQAFPNWFNASIWLEVSFAEAGQYELDLRLSLTDKPPTQFKLKAAVSAPGHSAAVVQGLQIWAESEGELLLEVRDGEEWKVVKRKKVLSGQVTLPFPTPSFVGPPPSDRPPQ